MGEIVNLNRARKERDRAAKQKQAAENRTRHGQTKAEKQARALLDRKADKLLDGHKVEKD